MTPGDGPVYGLIGALAAFPRRLAAGAVEAAGGRLQRGTTRQTTHLVLGRTLLSKDIDTAIEAKLGPEISTGRTLLSEAGFLRGIGLADAPETSPDLSRQSLLAQSGLRTADFLFLTLFDAFERDAEPFSFRDLILAKKYTNLIASGATWGAIARSVHRACPVVPLTALSLHLGDRQKIYAREGQQLSELDGQLLLALPDAGDDPEETFAAAEAAERAGDRSEAAALYTRCLALDPRDAIAAFNRANCLHAAGRDAEAANDYVRALRIDPGFVEAWFNLACLSRDRGQTSVARRHLERAVALDPDYADAVFNLASLEFESGNLDSARRYWERYLELDARSGWAQSAIKGLRYIAMQSASRGAG